jgi:uncharacterized radical SAM superfamily protein
MSCRASSPSPLVHLAAAPKLEPPLSPAAGMRLRRSSFGDAIQFFAPGLKRWQTSEWQPRRADRFLSVSVTGTACALSCDHCQSKVLEGMLTVPRDRGLFELARSLEAQGTEGLLVSGGSTRTGEVPLLPHLEEIGRARRELGMRIIVHSGVVSPELAEGLAEAGVEGVMRDVIGADETLREVYHLELSADDIERSLELLTEAGLTVLPHIVLGLHYGRFVGEWRALEMVRRHRVSTLILVVLTPLVGTPMEGLSPPPVELVGDFFAHAREALPETPVNLGCGRPLGAVKVALDKAAVDHGLNGIAYPAEGIVDYARRSGLEPEYHEYCCSLTWTGAADAEPPPARAGGVG